MFEHLVVQALTSQWPNVTLHHSGGRGDRGIDFFGNWSSFALVGQCKNHARACGPNMVREFAASLHKDEIGLLVASRGFSRDAIAWTNAVRKALMLLHMSESDASLLHVHVNSEAQALGFAVASSFDVSRRTSLLWHDTLLLHPRD